MRAPKLTQDQRDLLERSLKAIEAEPHRFSMAQWGQNRACGTVCCFAGQIAQQATGEPVVVPVFGYAEVGGISVEEIATKALRLSNPDALFFHSDWPDRFFSQYEYAKSDAGRAAALRARVEHWLQTGE